jgi:hypothetical protein
MDYGSLAITIAIIVYGVVEYRRRERLHRTELALVRRGETPPTREPQHPALALASIGATGILILVSEGVLIYAGSRFPRNFKPLAVVGVIFLLILIPVISMFRRDLRRYRSRPRTGRSAQ